MWKRKMQRVIFQTRAVDLSGSADVLGKGRRGKSRRRGREERWQEAEMSAAVTAKARITEHSVCSFLS